jgi:hypothetical protein
MPEIQIAELLSTLISNDAPAISVLVVALIFLFREVKNLKKIVSNGLSDKVTKTAATVERIEGYLEGSRLNRERNDG